MKDINKKIREARKKKRCTLARLAVLSGLTKGYLSKIEHGYKVPSVAKLQTIAQVLGVDFSELFNTETSHSSSTNSSIDIVRKKKRERTNTASSSGYTYQALVGSFKNRYMSPFLSRFKKGISDYFTHDSEEFFFVLQGSLELRYEGETHALNEGDSVYFDARKKHQFRNTRNEDALIVAVQFNYRRY